MRAVNLLPADAYAAKPKLPYATVVLASTAPLLASALVYLGYTLEHQKVADKTIALGVIEGQVAQKSPSPQLVVEASRVLDEKTKRQLELSDALAKQLPWDVAFDQIARVLPANAWLSGVQATSPTPAASAGAGGTAPCTITGYTMTQADVAQVLARLQLVPSLSDVQLISSSASAIGTTNVVQFTISASMASVKA